MPEGRVCLITGGGSGIGRATAVEMARRGARGVAILDVDSDGGEETVQLVRDAGAEAEFMHCDIRETDQVQSAIARAADRFGGIDVLHNNAGVHESYFTDQLQVHTVPEDVWQKVCDINLRGQWLCTKYAAPHLLASDRGASIINASSTGGIAAQPRNIVYGPMKAAIIMLTRQTAIDLAPNVRCNCYCPASVTTPMVDKVETATGIATGTSRETMRETYLGRHLIPRLGEPEEIAKLVCFLASDDAAWITGATYVIDGGMSAWRGTNQ